MMQKWCKACRLSETSDTRSVEQPGNEGHWDIISRRSMWPRKDKGFSEWPELASVSFHCNMIFKMRARSRNKKRKDLAGI